MRGLTTSQSGQARDTYQHTDGRSLDQTVDPQVVSQVPERASSRLTHVHESAQRGTRHQNVVDPRRAEARCEDR